MIDPFKDLKEELGKNPKVDLPELYEVFETEKEYRQYKAESQSKIKDWVNLTPFKWRDRYVHGEKFVPTTDMIMGTAVDIYITEGEEEYKKRVNVSQIDKPLTGNSLKIANEMLEILKNEDLITMEDVFYRAYERAGVKSPKVESWWENFQKEGNECRVFVEESLHLLSGSILITQEQNTDVAETVRVLKEHNVSRHLFENREDVDILGQFGISYLFRGTLFKALYDFIIIDHRNKKIRGIDLKTNFIPNEFGNYGFMKNRYYFQDAIYKKGLEALALANTFGEGYTVDEFEPFEFLVIDNKGIFEPTMWAFEYYSGDPWEGFKYRGGDYKGIFEIVEEYSWSVANGNFRTTKTIRDSNNKLRILI